MSSADCALEVVGVKKNFGGVTALDGVTLSLGKGEILGILGPNGSGKTTLVNCVSGVIVPDGGSVRLEGADVTRWSRERRAKSGMVRTYQNLRLFSEMTVAENITVGLVGASQKLGPRRRDAAVRESIDSHRLGGIARETVKNLSYGDQRRVEIARALIAEPRVLLLDEPAAGLGEADTGRLADAIRTARESTSCGIILIDHDVHFVTSVSDRIAVMNKGQLVKTGSPSEIQKDPFVAQIYLGTSEDAEGVDPSGSASADEVSEK